MIKGTSSDGQGNEFITLYCNTTLCFLRSINFDVTEIDESQLVLDRVADTVDYNLISKKTKELLRCHECEQLLSTREDDTRIRMGFYDRKTRTLYDPIKD